MSFAKVAIITRTKDRPLLLRRAFESVLGQRFQDWQLVVVNDGGDPSTIAGLVDEYREQFAGRVQVLHHEQSLGMEAASNRGIQATDSRYVAIHDDDDAWHPSFLQATVTAIEQESTIPAVGGAVTEVVHIEEEIRNGQVRERSRRLAEAWNRDLTLWNIYTENFFPPISFLYKREAFDKIGAMYREDLPVLGDWAFNLEFCRHYEIVRVDKPYAYYFTRVPGKNDIYSNTTTDANDKHDKIRRLIRNEALRRDLAAGTLGKGFLLNFLPAQQQLARTAESYIDRAVGEMETRRAAEMACLGDALHHNAEQMRIALEHINVLDQKIEALGQTAVLYHNVLDQKIEALGQTASILYHKLEANGQAGALMNQRLEAIERSVLVTDQRVANIEKALKLIGFPALLLLRATAWLKRRLRRTGKAE